MQVKIYQNNMYEMHIILLAMMKSNVPEILLELTIYQNSFGPPM